MQKLNKKKRSLEFLTIITAVVGIVIGVGIYVKNDNHPGHVLGDVGNPIVSIILWAFVGITVLTLMIFFLEIASSTAKTGNGTLSNWFRLFIGRKSASVVGIYYVFIYLPINYGFFATIIVSYILKAANIQDSLTAGELIGLYLTFGLLFIVFFSMLNCFLRDFSKLFQIAGTILKLVPLVLVLLAIAIPDTTWGVFFNSDAKEQTVNGGLTWSTSLESIDGAKIFSGFAPILFAFNSFISAANLQGETENKDLVGKTILAGVIFCIIFYVLVSLGLFLGSKDGSVVSFFDYMISGFKTKAPSEPQSSVSILIGNLVLAVICLISINSYTLLGPNFFYSDAKDGIIFVNNKRITLVRAAIFQMILGCFFFIILTLLGIFNHVSVADPSQRPAISYFFDQASNAGAIIGFTFYIILLIAGMLNRKTKRVEVKKLRNWVFWTCSIFSLISLGFMLAYSYVDFFILSAIEGPNKDLAKPISMVAYLFGMGILWILNEILFKKVPFNFAEVNTTFPIPKPNKRFVWTKKDKKNSKIKVDNEKNQK